MTKVRQRRGRTRGSDDFDMRTEQKITMLLARRQILSEITMNAQLWASLIEGQALFNRIRNAAAVQEKA